MKKTWRIMCAGVLMTGSGLVSAADAPAPLNPGLVGSSALPRDNVSQSLEPYEVPVFQGQRTGPGIAFGSQVGFGLNWGEASVGLGGQSLHSTSQRFDGSGGASFGIGNARQIALETTLNVISLVGFGNDGSFSFKLHRLVGPLTSISVGVEQVFKWGAARREEHSSFFAATHIVPLNNSGVLAFNGGVGSGRYKDADGAGGLFGGLAFIQNDRLSYILDYTGRDLNAAVSFVPIDRWPITVTVGNVNVLENDNSRRSFAGSAGLLIKF